VGFHFTAAQLGCMHLAIADLSVNSGVVAAILLAAFGGFCYALARLFARERRRSSYLAFVNNVSKIAISSEGAERMLAEIGREIRNNFHFEHIGIGILDYGAKSLEIKVDAGSADMTGRRVPVEFGITGRVARTAQIVLAQPPEEDTLLPEARSALCLPIIYGESTLGILNVESRLPHAFEEAEVLIMQTLADVLATALHNAFVFRKLQQQAITDGLTGIKTRRYFLESLQAEWMRASRSGRAFSVVMIDLDQFKEINDALGHVEGDLVLARVGRLLEQKCRQSNVVARYGGDEFCILMPETSLEQAQVLSERLRQWLAADPRLRDRAITGSFGVATFPMHGVTVEEIIRVADAGMYASKRAGGNRVSTGDTGSAETAHRQMMTSFIEGFLRREHTGPELADDLVRILHKLSAAIENPAAGRVALMEAVLTLSRASEARESHAIGHGDAVAQIAEKIGYALQLDSSELRDLVFAARVHDVGKILIPERILNKVEPLNADEFYLLKMHATLGAEICSAIPSSGSVQLMVRNHHERWDGEGYPDRVRGSEIPQGARIIAVAEAWTNMTSERPYAPPREAAQAAAEMQRVAGRQLDPALVELLLTRVFEQVDERAAEADD